MRQIIPPRNRWFLPALVFRFLLYILVRLLYRVSVSGKENIQANGPVILVANHLSFLDVLLLQVAYPRHICFVAHEYLFRIWWLGWAFRMAGVVPIQPRNARQAFRNVVKTLEAGRVVCLFPEGQISRTGCLQRLRPGFKVMAQQAGCPVQPAAIDGVWGSVFSYPGYRVWSQWPLRFRHSMRVHFGPVLQPDDTLVTRTRESILDLGAEAFSGRPALDDDLARRTLRALARQPWKLQWIEGGGHRRRFSRGKLLGWAIAHSRLLKPAYPGERVVVELSPGLEGAIARLALVLAGKTAVEGDVPAGAEETAGVFRELSSLGPARTRFWTCLAYLLPGGMLAAVIGLSRKGGRREAMAFRNTTTGPSSDVAMTHRNLVVAVEQLSSVNWILPGEKVVTSLSWSGGFGAVSGLWYPLMAGVPVVAVPPTENIRKIAATIREERPAVILGSPGFFRQALEEIDGDFFESLRFAFAEPETCQDKLSERFEGKYKRPLSCGYGTLGAPMASVNLPNPPPASREREEAGGRPGSVGRLLPGMSARIVSEDGKEPRPLEEKGRLVLKGPDNGWFMTGDIACFDEDGFLFLEGK